MNCLNFIIELNVLNYYYNLQVYKYFDFIRTILEYTNDALINKYNNVQNYTLKFKIEKDYNIKNINNNIKKF